MIDIFLAFGNNKDADGKVKYSYIFGDIQPVLSVIFLIVAFVSVPVMLYVKPNVLIRRMKAHQHQVEIKHEQLLYAGTVGSD